MDSQEEVYLKFYNYNFLEFPEYQEGLQLVFESFIFQHNQNLQPGEQEIKDINQIEKSIKHQLMLQAQVYFFCEKTESILSLDDYFEWKQKYESANSEKKIAEIENGEEAPYSSNYEKIVDLILTGKPVPGIKTIPDVVNEEPISKQELLQRKKPWEKNDASKVESFLDKEEDKITEEPVADQ